MSASAEKCVICGEPLKEEDEKVFLSIQQINGPTITGSAHRACAERNR
jgi:hypothetical protein